MSAAEAIAAAWRKLTDTDSGGEWFDVEPLLMFPPDFRVGDNPGEGEYRACPFCFTPSLRRKVSSMAGGREHPESWMCHPNKHHFETPVIVRGEYGSYVPEHARPLWEANANEWPREEGG